MWKVCGAATLTKRGDLAALLEVVDVAEQIEVRHAVGVVGEKHALAFQVVAHLAEALADAGVAARVGEGDLPVLDVAAKELDLLAALGEDEVVGDGLVVVLEVALDGAGAVPEAEDEVLVPVVGVVPHQVPEDRTRSDFHQGLRDVLRVVAKPHAEPAAKKHHLHRPPS